MLAEATKLDQWSSTRGTAFEVRERGARRCYIALGRLHKEIHRVECIGLTVLLVPLVIGGCNSVRQSEPPTMMGAPQFVEDDTKTRARDAPFRIDLKQSSGSQGVTLGQRDGVFSVDGIRLGELLAAACGIPSTRIRGVPAITNLRVSCELDCPDAGRDAVMATLKASLETEFGFRCRRITERTHALLLEQEQEATVCSNVATRNRHL
jgi:hypothetical protein